MGLPYKNRGKAGEMDALIGKKIAYYRKLEGYSQGQLGAQVDVTFQQIQKYEKGRNRVSASMLLAFSRILNVPIHKLYEESRGQVIENCPVNISAAKVRLIDTIVNSQDQELNSLITTFEELVSSMRDQN